MSRKRSKLDDLMEAISFAEAGEIDTANGIAAGLFREETPPQALRILAVSGSAEFSRRLVEQSLGMAERMGFGLVALSVAPAMAGLVARLRGRAGGRGARVPPETFHARAAERGVPFVHAVGRGDPEEAVVAATRRFRRIAFLLVEPELVPRARLTALPLPVFCLDPA